MTERTLKLVMRSTRLLAVVSFVVVFCASAAAQQNTQNQKAVSLDGDKIPGEDASKPFAALEEEMRAKRAIKFAEKEYQENLDRARDLSSLGVSIVASFKQKKGLDQEDIKKLEKVEKLAKGIRRAAGGSEDDVDMEKPPTDVDAALDMLGDLSKSLKDKVEKTPKHVISAAVIDEANVLLELIRIVRSLSPKV
jgi:nitric oxide reductase activation protein